MSNIDIAKFRQLSEEALLNRGFRKLKVNRGLKAADAYWAYALEGSEVRRIFSPNALRRPWGYEMRGAFGIEVPELRSWLISIGHEQPDATLGYVMANEFEFINAVAVCTEADWPKIEPWFDAIYSRVMSFPASVDELVGSLSNPARHLRLLRESRKDFWQNFQRWQEKA